MFWWERCVYIHIRQMPLTLYIEKANSTVKFLLLHFYSMQLHHSKTASEANNSLQCRRCAKFVTTVADPGFPRRRRGAKSGVKG